MSTSPNSTVTYSDHDVSWFELESVMHLLACGTLNLLVGNALKEVMFEEIDL